jgi:hypothetical protein
MLVIKRINKMRKALFVFVWKILLFIFTTINLFPTPLSIYVYFVDYVQNNFIPDNVFYKGITLGILLFRILLIYLMYLEIKGIRTYGNRYIFKKK